VLNTAFIERLNGTFRERLASLTRKSRHAASRMQTLHTGMYLIGCTYNFCFIHQELRKAKHWGTACTPAMESRLDRSYLEYLRIVTVQSGAFAVGRTQTTWTTKKAGRANRRTDQTSELPTALSAFGSSSQGGFMLNHRLVRLYQLAILV
jgi:hypothetical protein